MKGTTRDWLMYGAFAFGMAWGVFGAVLNVAKGDWTTAGYAAGYAMWALSGFLWFRRWRLDHRAHIRDLELAVKALEASEVVHTQQGVN